jgi:hypothetical protein
MFIVKWVIPRSTAPQPLAVKGPPSKHSLRRQPDFPFPEGADMLDGDQSTADQTSKQYRLWHVSGQSEFVAIAAEADTNSKKSRRLRWPDDRSP